MELKDQVCTSEQAKKLRKLGLSQTAYFSWCGDETFRLMDNGKDGRSVSNWVFISTTEPCNNMDEDHRGDVPSAKPFAAAFTVAELGIMLPPFFPSFVQDGYSHSHCKNERVDTFPLVGGETQFDTTPAHVINKELVPMQTGKTEAESRANMLIFLLEQNIITRESVNERLK